MPVITSLIPYRVIPGHTIVTIMGHGFSSSVVVDLDVNRVRCRFGTEIPTMAINITSTFITCLTPSTLCSSGIVSLSVSFDSGISWMTTNYPIESFDSPIIASVHPSTVFAGVPLELTIRGSGFSSDGLCRIGTGIMRSSIATSSLGEVLCSIPGFSNFANITVEISNNNGSDWSEITMSSVFNVILPPMLTAIVPSVINFGPGRQATITFAGTRFERSF